ncbi:MAG: hypothetical protein J6U82_04150 [Alistipes sp.]|nr:hypothetical protein [Alistipes sp.]
MKARFFAIAAMVLSLASCQRDQAGLDSVVAGEQDVNITVALPEVTRAANSEVGALGNIDLTEYDLRYILEVYEGEELAKERFVNYEDNATSTNFSMRLIPGRDYRFVVWADFVKQGTQADLHYDTSDLKSVKAINLAAIDESRDAYTAICNVEKFSSAKGIPAIELKRPFGKLRVQTTDVNQMTTLRPVGVTVTYVDTKFAHKFNAFASEVIADYVEVAPVTVDLTADACKYTNEDPEANGLQTLYADYFFATESGDVKFEFDVELNDGTVVPTLSFNTYIPVMRNVLTTVRGNVLTDGASIEVFINDTFEGDGILKDFVFVCNAAELQAAVNNYVAGQTIIFENDIKGNVMIPEYADTVLTIDGNGYKYDGCFSINGKSTQANATTLFKSINFETADASGFAGDAFIYCNEQTGNTRYPDNVTIQDCTFTATGAAVEAAVGAKFRQLKGNVIVENSSANGMHSLLQLLSGGEANVTIDGVEIANCKNGLSLQHSNNVIENTTIATREYGVRIDGAVAATSFENTEITATLPVVVRYMTADSNIALDFATTTLNAPGYQVVLTTGNDDKPFVAPAAGTYTLTGADSYLVFPGDYTFVYNAAQLQYVLDNVAGDTTIQFAANIEGNVTVSEIANTTITIDGNGYKYDGCFSIDGKTAQANATTIFKSINFETADASGFAGDAFIYCNEQNGNTRYPDNVTIQDCTFTATDAAVDAAVGAKFRQLKGNVIVENSSANGMHSLLQLLSGGEANVTVDGVVIANCKNGLSLQHSNNVIKNSNIATREYGVRVDGAVAATSFENTEITANLPVVVRYMTAESNIALDFVATTLNAPGYQVVLTTGNDDKTFVAPAAGTYTLTGADSYNVFPRDAADNKVAYTADDFKNLLAAGKPEIILMPGEYTMSATGGNDITIVGSRDVVLTVSKPNLAGADVTLEGITVKGSGYATGVQHVNTVTYNNVKVVGEMCLYGEAVTFNNCEFELANGQYIWTYGCKNSTFNNCVFNTAGKAILVYNEGAGATKVTVEGCTFNATAGAKAGDIANQNCAAIEISNFQSSGVGVAHNITASNNTVGENFSGEWRIKKFVAGNAITVNGTAYTQIAIDGKLMTIDASKNVTVL